MISHLPSALSRHADTVVLVLLAHILRYICHISTSPLYNNICGACGVKKLHLEKFNISLEISSSGYSAYPTTHLLQLTVM